MKYDSGMKHLHKDILDSLKSMLGKTGIAEIKPYIKGGSPAELREHLKERHGKCQHGGSVTSDRVILFNCTTQNLKLEYKHPLNNDGDRELTLSWSQVVVFIRNNWDSFCDVKEDTEKSYFDIFKGHFPKVEFDVLIGDYCPNEFFDYAPDSIGCDEDCEMCWRSIADKDAEFSAKGMVIPDRWKDEPQEESEQTDEEFEKDKEELEQASSDTVETETSLPDTITEDKQAVFDYSSLENDTATALRDCETAIRKETAGYFTLIGAKLKEAQELLADHSNGTFEQWYTALGFKRQTVYNLIQRYEFLSSPTIGGREEAFEALPVTLSYEISKPTAPPELVEKVLDGDITSNAEYKKIKAELEEANRKAEFWIKAHTDTAQENQQLRADRVTAMSRADNAERELEKAQSRIKDLESRPVEVAVQPDTAALEEKDRIINKLKSQLSAEAASVDELNRKNAELRNELEQQENDDVKIFAVKLTYEQLEKLIEIADHQNYYHIAQALKKAQSIRIK